MHFATRHWPAGHFAPGTGHCALNTHSPQPHLQHTTLGVLNTKPTRHPSYPSTPHAPQLLDVAVLIGGGPISWSWDLGPGLCIIFLFLGLLLFLLPAPRSALEDYPSDVENPDLRWAANAPFDVGGRRCALRSACVVAFLPPRVVIIQNKLWVVICYKQFN